MSVKFHNNQGQAKGSARSLHTTSEFMTPKVSDTAVENRSPLSFVRFTTTSQDMQEDTELVSSPKPQEWKVHISPTIQEDSNTLNVPKMKRNPSLMRQASMNVSNALDKSNIFPPEPKHEDESIIPHCSYRACFLSAWLMVAVICLCLIIVASTLAEQSQKIAEQEKQMSVQWISGQGVIDSCNVHDGDCQACAQATLDEDCVWIFDTGLFSGGASMQDAGVSGHSCRTRTNNFNSNGCPGLSPNTECLNSEHWDSVLVTPEGICSSLQADDVLSPVLTEVELNAKNANCREWAQDTQTHSCTDACDGNFLCCGEAGHLDVSFDTQDGTCTAQAVYCVYNEAEGKCKVQAPQWG